MASRSNPVPDRRSPPPPRTGKACDYSRAIIFCLDADVGPGETSFFVVDIHAIDVDWSRLPNHQLGPDQRVLDVVTDKFGSRFALFAKVEAGKSAQMSILMLEIPKNEVFLGV